MSVTFYTMTVVLLVNYFLNKLNHLKADLFC